MTRLEIVTEIKELVNAVDDDEIDGMLISAVNYAYKDLSKLDKRIETEKITVKNGMAELPDDCKEIINVTPSDKNDRRIGNMYMTNQTGTLVLVYVPIRTSLKKDTDKPDLSEALLYGLTLYGAKAYYDYRKKTTQAQWFLTQYDKLKTDFLEDEGYTEETVRDAYETASTDTEVNW